MDAVKLTKRESEIAELFAFNVHAVIMTMERQIFKSYKYA